MLMFGNLKLYVFMCCVLLKEIVYLILYGNFKLEIVGFEILFLVC